MNRRKGRTHMKARLVLAVTLVLTVLLVAVIPAAAAAWPYHYSTQFPIELSVLVPCANGGVGEEVVLSGELHDVFVWVFNDSGGYTLQYHDNPMGVIGIGKDTGTTYRATGVSLGGGTGRVGFEDTYVNNFRIIGEGTDNNFLVHETYHVTLNANGTLTAYVDNYSAECK
jgi:hypothetical protein